MAESRRFWMKAGGALVVFAVAMVLLSFMAIVSWPVRPVQDFSGPPAGTVIAGQEPGGGFAPGTEFPDFTLSVINNGGGPHSLLIFDSQDPSSCDLDLGTPHGDFGGPGVGAGGAMGQPGENSVPLGNLLIIAENIIDVSPPDGIVDEPDDEAGGGVVHFAFAEPQVIEALTLVDIDGNESATIELYSVDTLVGTAQAACLGDNSVETLDLAAFGPITDLDVILGASGGIAEITYTTPPTPTQESSWSKVKALFR